LGDASRLLGELPSLCSRGVRLCFEVQKYDIYYYNNVKALQGRLEGYAVLDPGFLALRTPASVGVTLKLRDAPDGLGTSLLAEVERVQAVCSHYRSFASRSVTHLCDAIVRAAGDGALG